MAILDNLTDRIYAFQIFKLLELIKQMQIVQFTFKLYLAKLIKNNKNRVIHTAPKIK